MGRTTKSAELDGILDGLIALIDEETRGLQSGRRENLGDFNRKKAYGLLEFSQALARNDPAKLDSQIARKFSELREKLENNSRTLKRHLDAMFEITAALSNAAREADSDGTYEAPRSIARG